MNPKKIFLAGCSLAAHLFVSGSSSAVPEEAIQAERVARFDKPFLDLSYEGSIFIEDMGDACRYTLPNLKVIRNSWPARVTRDVKLDELSISVFGEEPASVTLLELSYPISASFPVVHSEQQLGPFEFTIAKQILRRADYIALSTVGTLTIRNPNAYGAAADSRTRSGAWPMTVSDNRIISHPFGPDPDLARISYLKPSDPNDMCSSRKIR
ncbi:MULTISPECIES: hypothetical protein [Bradyrhizobium]|uniref:hypothetical protein n=1 Tax=Bradyrhizobium TaxID=374 RepID=UPI001EDA907C|nr:hypothetical protein [Bradyrhizobium zhengyangense]MCG2640841.1 hypothetical protein [Bradyrhizobium zhengyangense]